MMLRLVFAVLYTAFVLGANPGRADVTSATALRGEAMKKLVFHAEPQALPEVEFLGLADEPLSLSAYRGKWLVLNFWATWCPPCRKEMPGLGRLQDELGGDRFAVVTVASGRNPVTGITNFMAEAGTSHLPVLRDPKSALAAQIGIMGLPVTLILDPEGREVARLIGDAEWDSDAAKAVVAALLAD
jgi:thiol-disulfide isomerase/thioredoxin